MTTENLTEEQRKNILKAKELLCLFKLEGGFNWFETKEGENYWCDVCDALERIATSKPKICPKCGQEMK